jgi:glucokinase
VACLALGTGIGGGVVIENRLHLGIGGTAGELGHQTVDPYTDLRCGCGNRGCLEVFAAGPAITAEGIKAVIRNQSDALGRLAEYDLNRVTPSLVAQAAAEGDPAACEIYRRAGFYLGVAISNVLVIVSPQRVIIGGGVAQAGELLLGPARRTVAERVFMMPHDQVQIVQASLGRGTRAAGRMRITTCKHYLPTEGGTSICPGDPIQTIAGS